MATGTQRSLSKEMQECIDNCSNCHRVCLETIRHCLELGGEHAGPDHIRLLQDCAQICQTSADFMLRMSPFHPQTCAACAAICDACAEGCEKMAEGSDVMAWCAEACRRCAESCREMAAGASA